MKDSRRVVGFIIVLLIWLFAVQMYLKNKTAHPPQAPAPMEQTAPETDPQPESPTVPESPASAETPETAPSLEPGTAPAPEETPPAAEPLPELKEQTTILETGEGPDTGYLLECSNRGAGINILKRKDFFTDKDKQEEKLALLVRDSYGYQALGLQDFRYKTSEAASSQAINGIPLNERVWVIKEQSPSGITWETSPLAGILIQKTIVYDAEKDNFTVTITQINKTDRPFKSYFDMVVSSGVIPEYEQQKDMYVRAFSTITRDGSNDTDDYKYSKVKKGEVVREEGQFAWAAGTNKYFAVLMKLEKLVNTEAGIYPAVNGISAETDNPKKPDTNLLVTARVQSFDSAPGSQGSLVFTYQAVPIRKEDLIKAGIDHKTIISLGIIKPIGEALLFILKGIHAIIPNWGIAIILLTMLVAAVLYPLNRKSQISMAKMQKLQPLIKELNKKHKNNKQKKNEEYMKLLHKHGVNPLGGCLPMLIQFPVFIGLYFSLRGSFDLRQSEFLWINDLSMPDALFPLPFAGMTFNLLPILMAVAMFVQQKYSKPPKSEAAPKPGPNDTPDTQQQMEGAMKIMPWVMLFIFYRFPAGPIIYWLTNSIIRIFETYHIRHRLIPAMEAAQEGGKSDEGQK